MGIPSGMPIFLLEKNVSEAEKKYQTVQYKDGRWFAVIFLDGANISSPPPIATDSTDQWLFDSEAESKKVAEESIKMEV
jgi:hypothetical protein